MADYIKGLDSYFNMPAHFIFGDSAEGITLKEKARRIYIQAVDGDGMILAGIHSGDQLIMTPDIEPEDGDVVAATVDGQLMCRRLFRKENKTYFRREDGKTLDICSDDFIIHGVVIGVFRRGRFAAAGYNPDQRASISSDAMRTLLGKEII